MINNFKNKYTFDFVDTNSLLLFKYIGGSNAYGTNIEGSDIDTRGVYMAKHYDLLGFKDIPSEISDNKQDNKYYEISTFVKLLIKGNPNVLESLGLEHKFIQYCHPLFKKYILDNKKLFITKSCRDTFGGYAVSQIKKARGLNKKIVNPMPKERNDLIDFCYVLDKDKTYPLKKFLKDRHLDQLYCGVQKLDHAENIFALYYDKMSEQNFIDSSQKTLRHREANNTINNNKMGYGFKGIVNPIDPINTSQIRLSSIPAITDNNKQHIQYLCLISYNQGDFSTYCKRYSEYWKWVEERNESRYISNTTNGTDYDTKNIGHTIRLLNTCIDIFKTNGDIITMRPEKDMLLDIRSGKYKYQEILDIAELKLKEIDDLCLTSTLPNIPDEDDIQNLLINFRTEFHNQL